MISRPRGTRDFLPSEMEKRRALEMIFRETAEKYGYGEIKTPVFEHLELFTIKSGEGIIQEIYNFKDKGGRDLALRPELTAPVTRMVIEECHSMPRPLRFYYFDNCFRYERPQKGRYREFWQFGAELIGSNSPLADVEVISLAYTMLLKTGIKFELNIGHVGILRDILSGIENQNHIMRLIDKKDRAGVEDYLKRIGEVDVLDRVLSLIDTSGGIEVIERAREFTGKSDDIDHLELVAKYLENLEIEFTIDLGIARGLDYYTGVVFEVYAEGLGAQNQICGGGSYRLAHLFGGKDMPATGFALGFDRIAELFSHTSEKKSIIAVISVPGYEEHALKLASRLRERFRVITDVMGRSVKNQFSHASSLGCDYAVVIGMKEIETGKLTVKNLQTGDQYEVTPEEFIKNLNGMET